jgi:hypothetical protein
VLHHGAMKLLRVGALALAIAGCSKDKPNAPDEGKPKPTEKAAAPAPKHDAFQRGKWVRTTLYNGEPYLGYTYMDKVKGPCIKGEATKGLTNEELSKRLQSFPSSSMEPFPEDHPLTILTDAEVKELKLPTPPDWVASFE